MKESITKFDLEAAFKALDEIEAPKAGKVKANKPALTEIFSRKSKFDALMEEYYDISDMSELDDAKEAREAEVAQAKLARIEKIVDLDAESPEDLLPSYVGKFIIQCPQCMTLFYKDPEDIEASEEDPNTVNVSEVCQHCGNEAGYTLIGKVGEATQDEMSDFVGEETVDVASTDEDEAMGEEPAEDDTEDEELDLGDLNLDELDLDLEDDQENEEAPEEEKKEESFASEAGEHILVEDLREDADLEVSADEFEKLINSPEFNKPISDTEVRAMMDGAEDSASEVTEGKHAEHPIDKDLLDDHIYDIFYSGKFIKRPGLNTRIPAVKKVGQYTYKLTHPNSSDSIAVKFDSASESGIIRFTIGSKTFATKYVSEAQDIILKELNAAYAKQFDLSMDESVNVNNESLKYAVINPDGTYAGVPCTSEEEARELAAQKEGRVIVELGKLVETLKEEAVESLETVMRSVEELQEASLEHFISDSLVEAYGNVAGFRLSECAYEDNKLSVNGTIYFTSGNTRKTTYAFTEAYKADGKIKLIGLNEKLGLDKCFTLTGSADSSKTFITESFNYTRK